MIQTNPEEIIVEVRVVDIPIDEEGLIEMIADMVVDRILREMRQNSIDKVR